MPVSLEGQGVGLYGKGYFAVIVEWVRVLLQIRKPLQSAFGREAESREFESQRRSFQFIF
jgi:hypothetical protein